MCVLESLSFLKSFQVLWCFWRKIRDYGGKEMYGRDGWNFSFVERFLFVESSLKLDTRWPVELPFIWWWFEIDRISGAKIILFLVKTYFAGNCHRAFPSTKTDRNHQPKQTDSRNQSPTWQFFPLPFSPFFLEELSLRHPCVTCCFSPLISPSKELLDLWVYFPTTRF